METLSFDIRMLWPIVTIFALTFGSGLYLVRLRVAAVKTGETRLSFYRSYRKGEETEQTAVATRHFSNLFETPTLFYVGCLTAGLLGPTPTIALTSAWLFVVLRVTQSFIHLTSNNVLRRASAFWTSSIMLLVLWGSNVALLTMRSF